MSINTIRNRLTPINKKFIADILLFTLIYIAISWIIFY